MSYQVERIDDIQAVGIVPSGTHKTPLDDRVTRSVVDLLQSTRYTRLLCDFSQTASSGGRQLVDRLIMPAEVVP